MVAPHRILLFDLGGVLIRLRIAESLETISPLDLDWESIKAILLENRRIRQFECGACSRAEFAESFIQDLQLDMSAEEFLTEMATWPVGFFDGALTLLADLRQHYSVNCFSNTNEVHWQQHWADQFDHPFASHLIGLAKPDPAAFRHVLADMNAAAETVWFFDDSRPNVEAANALGLNAFHTDGFEALLAKLVELSFIESAEPYLTT
ncbi:HAD family phosphatase [Parvularcula sp. IMCC14364]|uniref:HAD family hydrolase n=1 Tax=Parvularcula sp. IMCC14364 TaxID=3067902 RepID=UPI00274250D1|nr:HAD family phosphatase [Parvularcula sp. IMCC14364]